jgi:hypothetical protein
MTFAVSGTTSATGANISINVTTGPSGPIVTFDAARLTQAVNNLIVTQTYDPKLAETPTGATYGDKPVYRQAWRFGITQTGNCQDDHVLIGTAGYVDAIVNSGGYFSTGATNEKYNIPSRQMAPGDPNNNLSAFPLVSGDRMLKLSSISNLQRNNADTFVWVDFTKA